MDIEQPSALKSADGCFIYIPVIVDEELKNAKITVVSFYSDFNKREQKSIPSYGNAFDSYIMPKYKRSFDDDQS